MPGLLGISGNRRVSVTIDCALGAFEMVPFDKGSGDWQALHDTFLGQTGSKYGKDIMLYLAPKPVPPRMLLPLRKGFGELEV